MSESEKIFFYQQKECPVCLNKITVTRLRSSYLRLDRRDTDLNLIYKGVNPTHYSVWVCETCNYAALDGVFEQPIPAKEKEDLVKGLYLLKEEEPSFIGVRTPETALRSYELAIRTAQIRHCSKGTLAPLFLRAAWIARELGQGELEHQYLQTARDYYTHAFEKERGLKLTAPTLMYLIGELNRRTGRFDEAIRWFSRAISAPGIKAEPEIERLARNQWELAKEESHNAPKTPELPSEESAAPATPPAPQPTSSAPESPPSAPLSDSPKDPLPPLRNRPRLKMMASLYKDQIDWLQAMVAKGQKETGVLLEKETLLRALLDGFIASGLTLPPCRDEETLRKGIYDLLQSYKKEQ